MRLPNLPFWNRPPPVTIFVPGERFFVRVIPLAPEANVEQQVELALEGLAPFPLPQLFWGYLAAADRRSALVYAAHRRRFSPEETKSWQQAALVVPTFLALAGRPGRVPAVLLHPGGAQLAGVAWRQDDSGLPAAVVVRGYPAEPTPEERQALARELAARAGLPGVEPRLLPGQPRVTASGENLQFQLDGGSGPVLAVPASVADQLDVRDRDFLAGRRQLLRRGTVLWRTLAAGLAALVVAALLEAAAFGLHLQTKRDQAKIAAHKPTVDRLETEHTLATRVDDLARQRLLPFEMLVVLNDKRPKSVQFVRTTTQGSNALEVEAQTANASDVSSFEQALQEAPGIAEVKTRDIRARDGVTSFVITVVFKPEALQATAKNPA